MNALILPTPLPCSIQSVFARVITLGWYDGITSGLAQYPANVSFRFDLLAWGPMQERRIFALSALSDTAFEGAVRTLESLGPPVWPRWNPRWPSDPVEEKRLDGALDEILKEYERPKYAIETDSMFEEVFTGGNLDQGTTEMIPDRFEVYPISDHYDFWYSLLEAST